MNITWTPDGQRDREHIENHIAADTPRAAEKMDELFSAAATRLAAFPHNGRPGRVPGTRELVHQNYMLVYAIIDEGVWILALLHTSREWPPPPNEG